MFLIGYIFLFIVPFISTDESDSSSTENDGHREKRNASRKNSSDEGIASQSSTQSTPKRSEKSTTTNNLRMTRSRKTLSKTAPSTSGIKRKELREKQKETNDSDLSSDESSSDDGNNFENFVRTTRNGTAVLKLLKRIEDIMNDKSVDVNVDDIKCIICCDKKKTTLLLPCKHQQTCPSCWYLWCAQCLSKQVNVEFDEKDENVTKPTCPYCKGFVDDTIEAIN